MARKKIEKPGQLTACSACGTAVIVAQDGEYEPVAFSNLQLEVAIRGAYALALESPFQGKVARGVNPELDEYVAEWTRSQIEQAEERARG